MNHKLTLIQYFDTIVNDVDINAENLLLDLKDQCKIDEINSTRLKYISEIKSIEKFCIENYTKNIQYYDTKIKEFKEKQTKKDKLEETKQICAILLDKKFCFLVNLLDPDLKTKYFLTFTRSF